MSGYFRGDIVLVPFPFSDQTNSKVRPAIVISNATVNKTQDVVLAQITSQPINDDFSFSISDKDVTRSLEGSSQIRCHKIFTTEKSIIKKKISTLNPAKQTELMDKIINLLR